LIGLHNVFIQHFSKSRSLLCSYGISFSAELNTSWKKGAGFMKTKRRRKNKSKKSSNKFFLLFVLMAIVFFPYFSINFNRILNLVIPNNSEAKLISAKSLGNLRLTPPTPIFTPTPTSIPTPTPVPLVGYCLNVPVLFYHHIQPQSQAIDKGQTATSVNNEVFDQQIQYLISRGYTFLTAKELVDALRTKSQVPAKSIVVTLDDGYLDSYQYAYPIFKKYNIKANFMIATGLLGGSDYMVWEQVKKMAGSGLIYFMDHTWSHYGVGYGTADKIRYEISMAKQQLQENTGQTIDIFAYPYGSFNDLSINILKQEGFVGAFSTIFGDWQCDSFIMALHRRRIGNAPLSYYGL